MRILFVARLDSRAQQVYALKWKTGMKLLIVSKLDRSARAIHTITQYIETGKRLGHEVAVFGEQLGDFPQVPTSLRVQDYDFAVFVVYDARDFPDLPYLARLLDGVPKKQRAIIDCCGRYNDTIRVEHDFNHLEKLDGHQGWEWVEGFEAVSDKILQPTLHPRREGVRSFLFHGFNPEAVVRSFGSAAAAARAWSGRNGDGKPYGLTYVGNNWQRWSQVETLLKKLEPIKDRLGPLCFGGWDWDREPEWARKLGIKGVDVDLELMERLGVEIRLSIPFGEVAGLLSQGRFTPVIHRPLFNELGLVTNRTFATFHADTIPLLLVPDAMVEDIYGAQAAPLAPGDAVADRVADMLQQPEKYWAAVLATRQHLAERHSYERRWEELTAILEA